MIEDLFQQHGLADATHVLLTGDSAGGVGAMNNADWIGGMLRYKCLQSSSGSGLGPLSFSPTVPSAGHPIPSPID